MERDEGRELCGLCSLVEDDGLEATAHLSQAHRLARARECAEDDVGAGDHLALDEAHVTRAEPWSRTTSAATAAAATAATAATAAAATAAATSAATSAAATISLGYGRVHA